MNQKRAPYQAPQPLFNPGRWDPQKGIVFGNNQEKRSRGLRPKYNPNKPICSNC